LNETSTLIAQNRKIVEAAHSDTLELNALLNMILQIVTNIDKRILIMETTMIKGVDDLKKEILSVSVRVRKLENLSTDLTIKVTECESSCQGVSHRFDNVDKQIKTNTRNIIHHDQRHNKLEENPNESNADRSQSEKYGMFTPAHSCLRIQDKVGKHQYITEFNQQRVQRASGIRYRFMMPLHEKQYHFYKFSRTTNRRCGEKTTHIYI
jgi:hypothetical protein